MVRNPYGKMFNLTHCKKMHTQATGKYAISLVLYWPKSQLLTTYAVVEAGEIGTLMSLLMGM